ncbi:hypothetical protein ANN_04690 [Periplaneta americana]|uniref:DUF4817 domain-containing protein n=1 Tax=Periplaneta americana TaxID=6978 RepID=A0ABQ8TBI4_PERAM|nr:hypothetical protein ANN_04690 [Periplaneta americana]
MDMDSTCLFNSQPRHPRRPGRASTNHEDVLEGGLGQFFRIYFFTCAPVAQSEERRNLDVNFSGSNPRQSFSFYCVLRDSIMSLPSKETLRGHSDSSFRGEGYIQCCVGVRLCDMYSNQELAEIHFMYGKADGNAALARRLYQERYPQRQCPDRKTFVRLHYRLCEYGTFNSPGLGRGRPRSTTPEVQEEILEAVNMTPSISTRRVALQVNVPHTTVWRLLKEYQLYPYHLQRVQALSPADYPARVRFCQWFLQQCGVNPNFPALVLFTDEAQFTRDGITNFHNQHVWVYENPRATVPSHHQEVDILNIFCNDNDLRKEKRSGEFQCCEGHNSEMKHFRTHVVMNYFDCLHVGNTYLKLCPVVLKHSVHHLYINADLLRERSLGPQNTDRTSCLGRDSFISDCLILDKTVSVFLELSTVSKRVSPRRSESPGNKTHRFRKRQKHL